MRQIMTPFEKYQLHSFRKQAHRQAKAVAASTQAREDQAFIDAVSELE